MQNPEYVRIKDKKYKINTDFRIALKCNEIAQDTTISDTERGLAIIYLLYGDAGYDDKENRQELLNLAVKYLKCGDDEVEKLNEKPDMDLIQDYRLIEASFRSDYGINLTKENMHWWDFYTCLNGLTDKCVLNRVRDIRTCDLNTIKDSKERNRIKKLQKQFSLKEKEIPLTANQKEAHDKFYELMGITEKE